ncbi:MAG: UTP--glucose-1-phosphate uridylyltransferase [Kiritimatiellae bacterium]|nr:UTP--glucose-1-phosphate uridylyltransferase [Kiritimatiellia bacterium]
MPHPAAEAAVRAKLEADHAPALLRDTYLHYWRQWAAGETGLLPSSALEPAPEAPDAEHLPAPANAAVWLRRAAVVKLNGGLGTGMGLDRAKSLLPAKDGLSFLDLIVRQILRLREQANAPRLPLVFMNSFRTEDDTRAAVARHPMFAEGQGDLPFTFLQHRVPKVSADTGAPVDWPRDPDMEWCPPGHGDLYTALMTTGMLPRLRAAGIEILFVSNADNLGATLDPRILAWFGDSGLAFAMEVADRTESDRKGGHVARRRGGGWVLRESAQCPPEDEGDFQDITRYRYFNTNNLWLRLDDVERALRDRRGILGLPLIRNEKTVDPTDRTSPRVIQLETAMGAALSAFENAGILRVPRLRFAPVKTTEDLLALWSDAYERTPEEHVRLRAERRGVPPVVKLEGKHYKFIGDFQSRFPEGAPSLLHCARLDVRGDVTFGRNVTVRGSVTVESGPAARKIPDGTTLEG